MKLIHNSLDKLLSVLVLLIIIIMNNIDLCGTPLYTAIQLEYLLPLPIFLYRPK